MSNVLGVLIAAAFVVLSSAAMAQDLQVSSLQGAAGVSEAGQSITFGNGTYDSEAMSSTLGE